MAEEVKLKLTIEAAQSATTLGDLKKSVEDLTQELEAAEIGSDAYKQLNQQLINTNKQVKNLELGFEALDAEQVASEVGSVAGAIGDIGTGLVLMSGGNEQLEEMVGNIENALGISMALKGGIEGLQSARKLWNDAMARGNQLTKVAIALQETLNKASKANVFLAFATAVAAVAAAILTWGKNASATEKAQEALNDAALKGAAAAGEEEAKVKALAVTIMDATASTEARKKALDDLNEVLPDSIGLITEETIATGEAVKAIQEYIETVRVRAELAAAEEILQEQIAKRMELQLQLQMAGNDANSQAGAILQNGIDQSKEFENAILSRINVLNQEVAAIDDGTVAQGKQNVLIEENTRFTKDNTEAKIENKDAEEDLTKRREAALLELRKMEIESIEDKYERERQLAQFNFEQEIAQLDENLEEENQLIIAKKQELDETLAEINLAEFEEQVLRELEQDERMLEARQWMADEEARIEKEKNDKIKADRERFQAAAKQSAMDLFKATEALAGMIHKKDLERAKEKVKRGQALSKAEEANLRRQEKIQKGFALAQIAVDTAMGIAGAVSSAQSMPYPANLVAIGTGIAAVMAGIVSASQVLGESSEIPQVDMPDVDLGDGANEATQDAPLSNFGSGSTLIPPQQVYVVESDITETQNNVAVVESQATFS